LTDEMMSRLWSELGEIRANSKATADGIEFTNDRVRSIDKRVRVIENLKHKIMGMVAVVTLIGGAVWAWIMEAIVPRSH
jgi:DNA repair ATPase RecN